MNVLHLIPVAAALLLLHGCIDLDIRPNSNIVLPKSIGDFEELLKHESVTTTGALAHLHGGEFLATDFASWQYWPKLTQRNAYTWASNLYEGEVNVPDWNKPYEGIFYCNNVLEQLHNAAHQPDHRRIKGWALFARAYLLYDLTLNFGPAYNSATAADQLGIPLKLTAGINDIQPRASLQACYDQILGDMHTAESLIDQPAPTGNRNQPSKAAVAAFLARLYLQLGDYASAENQATRALNLFGTLTDYNTLDTLSNNPFTRNTAETIYFSRQAYGYLSYGVGTSYHVDPELRELYAPGDLRLPLYFRQNNIGLYGIKPINTLSGQPFTGLAVDEVYLIKAECLARKGGTDDAIALLNTLLATRFQVGKFIPLSAPDPQAALALVLLERRRALIFRCLRWQDIKRLNREGHGITLSHELDGKVYTLPPNDPRYVFPIPEDEVARSGIQQNER